MGEEDPVDGLLELGPALQLVHAVVGQRARESGDESLRQALALDIERVEVGPEGLAGAADAFAFLLVDVLALCRGQVPGELSQVGEDREDLELAVQQLGIIGRQLVPCPLELADEPAGLLHTHVKAHDQAAQRVQMLARAKAGARIQCSGRRAEADPRGLGRRRALR